jgi:hypothetical protein
MFNPTEYTISKSVGWTTKADTGSNIGKLEFKGGNPIELKLKLQFDTSLSGKNVQDEHTKKLWALSMVNKSKKDANTKKSSPPKCEFHWGGGWSFEAVVTSISEQLTMFLPDGTPIRSQVDISLKQSKDPGKFPFQNPTSGGVPGHRTHVVLESETLDWIAASEYGEARHWRYIAEQNNLDNPMQVPPGAILQLPPLPQE